jgi:hypothetical protein
VPKTEHRGSNRTIAETGAGRPAPLHWLRRALAALRARGHRYAHDRSGQVALVFAISTVALLTAVGSGLDLGRAYLTRQQLSATVALTCQYANRPSVAQVAFGSGGSSSYAADVNTFLTAAWNSQNPTYSETNATPFTYTTGGAGIISVAANVPTTLMNLVGVRSIPVSVTKPCFDQIASTPPPASNGSVIREGFDNNAQPGHYNWYLPNGSITTPDSGVDIVESNSFPSTVGYIGATGVQWYIMGYCLEVDSINNTSPVIPQGSYSAELDCDNSQDNAGNSSISTQAYLGAGSYELRYFYKARIRDKYYTPGYICGSSASDVSWATDGNYDGLQGHTATDQINVYLDPAGADGNPPTHSTQSYSGSPPQTLAGADLIDTCVYAADWVERSVPITVTTAGYYWLSFAADGFSDSYGGLIDDIRLCTGTCTDTTEDYNTDNFANNFPWTDPNLASATSNWTQSCMSGSANTSVLLFEDTLQDTSDTSDGIYAADLASSGAFEDASCWTAPTTGWAAGATNKVAYVNERSGYTPPSPLGMSVQINYGGAQLISRPFLLVPGYYKLGYDYEADAQFSLLNSIIGSSGQPSTFCGATPSAASYAWLSGGASSFSATSVVSSTSPGTLAWKVNPIAAFISSGQLVSTPILSSTLGDSATYLNPGSTTASSSETVAPDAINLSAYTASSTSALLDLCLYASSWQQRTAYIQIVKPGYYWLTFSTLASTLGASTSSLAGSIANVDLTAIGGPSISTVGFSSTPVAVPAPGPAAGSTITYTTTDSSGNTVTAFSIPGETYK